MAGQSCNGRVTVLLAEDHPIYREGLARAIEDRCELDLVATTADGREALEAVRELNPAVAVLDMRLPRLSGAQVLNAITRDELGTKVVILSARGASKEVFEALQFGAAAYLTKDACRKTICETVIAVARGETVLAPAVQSALVDEIRQRDRDVATAMSPREAEILKLVAGGLSSVDIAERLCLSPATVKTHLRTLYEKLGVRERAAAVAEAMRRGLLE